MTLLRQWHDSQPVVPLEAVTFPKGIAHPWLAWIAEPRIISLILGLFHSAAIGAGISAVYIPDGYYATLGGFGADAWGILAIIGGVLGLAGALPGYWWIERCGLILEFFATLAWQVAVTTVHHDPGAVLAWRIMLGVMVQVSCVNRYVRISGAYLDPRRISSTADTP